MSDSTSIPPGDQRKLPPFRVKPSRNQKRRSKLQQQHEEPAPAAPTPPPAAPPPPTPPSAPLLRHNRLKRSGHMHDDLRKPLPEDDAQEREPEY